jgi:hypothetical protein
VTTQELSIRLAWDEARADVDPDFLVHDVKARVLEATGRSCTVPDAVDPGLTVTWRRGKLSIGRQAYRRRARVQGGRKGECKKPQGDRDEEKGRAQARGWQCPIDEMVR